MGMSPGTVKLLFMIMSFSFFLPLKTSHQNNQSLATARRAGRWSVLQKSIGISAMHMQLLHNNKVVMYDRTDFGPSNLSLPRGLCRSDPNDTVLKLDCTAHSVLYDIATNTYRPLMVQTDTWCSSGAVLHNGTLVQTGGYNDGDRTIRTFTPCEHDINCEWTELPNYLSRRRWYASNQILPDGRIIVVGGRRQFNYEFYPNTNPPCSYYLQFLRTTTDAREENNLYPFLHLLPDGNLFIFANTKSILFDHSRGHVIREFPDIPGGHCRNYPCSGSSVLLPLQGDSLNPKAEILVCGGAPRSRKPRRRRSSNYRNSLRASSTCGRLVASDHEQDPKWEMEEMPTPRVMGDMVLLPTGDLLIVNGASLGIAGWERASLPTTRPALYHPNHPPGSRFSVMSRASRPRLYHSSAILLPDGRVLVGGSNPHVSYNFSHVHFPTDLSLEAFSPPYILSSRPKPRIVSFGGTMQYGKRFELDFHVDRFKGRELLSVRIVSPSFTTHSFGMNLRMVVLRLLEVQVNGTTHVFRLSGVGPPTDRVAPPGYYMLFVVHRGVPSLAVWAKIFA